jgi:hypothetical protein
VSCNSGYLAARPTGKMVKMRQLLTKESHPEFIRQMAFFESIVYQAFLKFIQNQGG